MNKYGISYNAFDGVELLEDSINSMKEFVSYISVILQTESYWGDKLSQEEIDIVESLKDRGIIDELVYYEDNNPSKVHKQTNKRNLGRKLAKENGCTHYMSMDCDEFYTKEDLQRMVDYHEKNTSHVSYMPIWDYYKDSKYLIIPHYYYTKPGMMVSGIFPIDNELVFGFPLNYLVDPTRKPNISDKSKIKIWHIDEMKLHHMCYVRADIYKKVYNACAKQGYGNKIEHFKYLTECYNTYEINKRAVGAVGRVYEVIEIEPVINLDIYYNNLEKLKNKKK